MQPAEVGLGTQYVPPPQQTEDPLVVHWLYVMGLTALQVVGLQVVMDPPLL